MAFDYKQYFGDIVVAQNLVTRPEERTWRLAAPPPDAEHHDIVLYLGCNVLRTSHMINPGFAIWTDGRPSGGVHRAGGPVGQLVHASQHLNGSHSGEPEGLCDPLPPSVIAAITPSQTPPPRRLLPLLVGWVR